MRRIAVLLTIILVPAGCTAAQPVVTETNGVVASVETTPVSTAPAGDICNSVTDVLDGFLADLGMGHFELEPLNESGPFARYLPTAGDFAVEFGMDCSSGFHAHSPFGEMVQVIATWDPDHVHAAIAAVVRPDISDNPDDGFSTSFDSGLQTQLYRINDELYRGYGDWRALYSLEGIVAVAGDDPIAALGAWNRAVGSDTPRELLRLSTASGWGGGPDIPDFTLYSDGRLLTPASASGYPRTFSHGAALYTLTSAQTAEIEAMTLATGITEGEGFDLPDQGVYDAGSLGIAFRHEDVTYLEGLYNPVAEEATVARQQLVDLNSHVSALVETMEPTVWIPDTFVVKVSLHGPHAESNTMIWPGSFDLEAAQARLCTLLDGSEAQAYLDDVARIGAEYRDRYKTIFEDGGSTYAVQAIMLPPGTTVDSVDDVPTCNSHEAIQFDPALSAALWNLRQITGYEIEFTAECAACDLPDLVIDGSSTVTIPGWGEFRTIQDLFEIVLRDDLEVAEFVTDGMVGFPVLIAVANPEDGERLVIRTSVFKADGGSVAVEFHPRDGIRLDPTGFDEWMP